jgi:hypothetical protein
VYLELSPEYPEPTRICTKLSELTHIADLQLHFLSKTTVSKQMADSKAWAAATKAPCHGKSAACVLC